MEMKIKMIQKECFMESQNFLRTFGIETQLMKLGAHLKLIVKAITIQLLNHGIEIQRVNNIFDDLSIDRTR